MSHVTKGKCNDRVVYYVFGHLILKDREQEIGLGVSHMSHYKTCAVVHLCYRPT